MKNINQLLRKYEKPYTPGERRSKEFDRRRKQEERKRRKHELVDEIGGLMFLHKDELTTVHYMVDRFTSFKEIHGNASNEAIIAAFCFTFVRIRNSSARMEDYKACRLYGLTPAIWGTVQSKVIGMLLSILPVFPHTVDHYDHGVLCRGSLEQAARRLSP